MESLLKPGIRRAGLMTILGAVAGAMLVVILRYLQNFEPVWDAGTLLVFAVIFGLGGLLTGLGVLNPAKIFAGDPGLPRATSMAVLGFLLGGLFVIVLRGLQSLTPLWDTGVGIVVMAFTTTGFFVWGMGAFDPRMSVHGEHAHEIKPAAETEEDAPTILGTYIWQISFYLIVLMIVIAFFALVPGGPGLHITAQADGSSFLIGEAVIQLPFNGPEVVVSQLVIFILFIIFTLFSLAVAGGGVAFLMFFLSKNVTQVRATQPTIEDRTPPGVIRALGRFSGWLADGLRRGIPRLFGQKG